MISLLIGLLVLVLVIFVVHYIIDLLALPPNVKQIVYVIVGLVFLLILLSQLGIVAPGLVVH